MSKTLYYMLLNRDQYREMARTRIVPKEARRQIVKCTPRKNIKQVGAVERIKLSVNREEN